MHGFHEKQNKSKQQQGQQKTKKTLPVWIRIVIITFSGNILCQHLAAADSRKIYFKCVLIKPIILISLFAALFLRCRPLCFISFNIANSSLYSLAISCVSNPI